MSDLFVCHLRLNTYDSPEPHVGPQVQYAASSSADAPQDQSESFVEGCRWYDSGCGSVSAIVINWWCDMWLNWYRYRHSAWEYAFRFLRVSLSLSLSSPTHQDSVSALHHLHKISQMANRNGDKAVSAMAAVIEALAHLQLGSNFDSIEQAQRAVATARSHQLNDDLRHIPQLITLVQMVDICCSLLEYDVNQSAQKLRLLQEIMDERLNYPNWRVDGSFSVPLNGKSAGPSSIDTGDILQVQNGTLLLSFSWLPQHDLYALCYFLSSVTLSAKNSHDGRKAEKFLQEGRRMLNSQFPLPLHRQIHR